MSKRSMLDGKPRSVESLKSRNGELPQQSALKTRRGGKQTQPRQMQNHRNAGEGNLREGLRARHSLQHQAMCPLVGGAREAHQRARELGPGAQRVALVGAPRLAEDEEQELDTWHRCIFP